MFDPKLELAKVGLSRGRLFNPSCHGGHMLILLCQSQGALHESGPFWGIVRARGAKAEHHSPS